MRKIEKTTNIDHALFITPDDLTRLMELLKARFPHGSIEAQCEDDTKFHWSLEEILAYENPNFRRLKSLIIYAKNDKSDVTITIGSSGYFSSRYGSIRYSFDDLGEFTAFESELKKRLGEFKPLFSFLTRYTATGVLLWLLILTVFLANIASTYYKWKAVGQGTQPKYPDLGLGEMLVGGIVFAAIFLFVGSKMDSWKEWFFPSVFFNIGKQVKNFKIRMAILAFVLITTGWAFWLNVGSNWFYDKMKNEPVKVEPPKKE